MKKRLYHFAMLLFIMIFSFKLHAQVEGLDSLQKKILDAVQKNLDKKGISKYYFDSASIFKGKSPVNLSHMFDELNKNLATAKSMGDMSKLSGGYQKLSTIDSMRGNYKGAYENYKLYALYRDSLQKKETEKKELQAKMQYEFDKKQAISRAEQEKKDAEQRRTKNLQYFTIAGLTVVLLAILLIAFIQWRNNQQRKKANILLQQQKTTVESTLSELKSTQAQLVQSEKMASLGELTAGIAHEIQNPLNFINNFSELNNELIEELKNENDISEIKIIATDIRQNNEKVVFHGKRADDIVKGMLQHSRSSTGIKEPTDINKLADEYLQLAYHGLKAKDKGFNVKIQTDFDKGIDKVNVIAPDIGRVLLNLITNAFYALKPPHPQKGTDFVPTVSVSTKKRKGNIEIHVKDNGTGIPQKAIDKIFQPFFTTKPTGSGTGLGLSLSYDIVKAHLGEIKVETKEGEGSNFIVILPS